MTARSHLTPRLALLLAVLCAYRTCAESEPQLTLVVDIGDEYMKVAAVNQHVGYPLLDIALNEQSERKTPVVVGFEQDGEMRVGDSASALKVRAPSRTFHGLMQLLGEPVGGDVVAEYVKENPQLESALVRSARGTVAFKVDGVADSLSVEALLALYMRALTSSFSVADILLQPETVKEVVLVVPEQFTAEKTGLLKQCAELAGFRVGGVVPQLASAVIDYAVGGKNSGAGAKQTVVAYGMGGTTTAAALFHIERTLDKEKKRKVVIKCSSLPFTAPVGGRTLTHALASMLTSSFDQLHPTSPIAANFKARAKILRAAAEAKEILSVSPAAPVTLEKLHEQKSLAVSVSVRDFEAKIKPLADTAVSPLSLLLSSSSLTPNDITVCELFGGGLRVPLIAKTLTAAFPKLTFGRHINGDEGAVFGAAALVASGLGGDKVVFEAGPFEELINWKAPPAVLPPLTLETMHALIAAVEEGQRLLRQERERGDL